jgi:hypothetical protein
MCEQKKAIENKKDCKLAKNRLRLMVFAASFGSRVVQFNPVFLLSIETKGSFPESKV